MWKVFDIEKLRYDKDKNKSNEECEHLSVEECEGLITCNDCYVVICEKIVNDEGYYNRTSYTNKTKHNRVDHFKKFIDEKKIE